MSDAIKQAAESVWSAGGAYIGPSVESLQQFVRALGGQELPAVAWLQIERDSKDSIARTSLPRYYDRERWEFAELVRADAAAAALAQRDEQIAALREQVEALKKDAARYAYIKSQMEAGAVETQLPLCRSLFWVGTHVDCGDVRHADAAIDEAIAGNQPWNRVAAGQAAPPRQDDGEIPRC